MNTPVNKPRRLFELLVVGGALWVAACGPDTGANNNTGTNTGTVTLPDGGRVNTGAGGGSEFW